MVTGHSIVIANDPPDPTSPPAETSDAELVAGLASGRPEAAGPLYARYAPIVFGMARQSVDPAAAEEIVQDVFVAVWKGARTFDPARGSVRAWLLQIAHFRIANELRRRRRRPVAAGGERDEHVIASLPEGSPASDERLWLDYRSQVLRSALAELPAPQRQALGLSFFDDLSHSEIASILGVPIGTAKSRIRLALTKLRGRLGTVSAAALTLALAVGLSVWAASRLGTERDSHARDRRAIQVLTSSEAEAIRASAAGSAPAEAHATWRAKRGEPLAVVTLSHFPPAAPGTTDRVWASIHGAWIFAGSMTPDASGRAVLVVEGTSFASRPDRIEVRRAETRRPVGSEPSGELLAAWPAAPTP